MDYKTLNTSYGMTESKRDESMIFELCKWIDKLGNKLNTSKNAKLQSPKYDNYLHS